MASDWALMAINDHVSTFDWAWEGKGLEEGKNQLGRKQRKPTTQLPFLLLLNSRTECYVFGSSLIFFLSKTGDLSTGDCVRCDIYYMARMVTVIFVFIFCYLVINAQKLMTTWRFVRISLNRERENKVAHSHSCMFIIILSVSFFSW